VAGALVALVQAAGTGGIDAAWGRWVWADVLIRAADLAVRNGRLPPEPHGGELRTGLLHVKRELDARRLE
jgi:hypothetical protein